MARPSSTPPRPFTPGDVVTTYSELLGGWTVGQLTHLDGVNAVRDW